MTPPVTGAGPFGCCVLIFTVVSLLFGGCAAPSAPVEPTVDSFPTLLMKGDTLAASGRRTAAEEIYREAAAVRPTDPLPHLRLAWLYLGWGRPEDGLDAVEAAEQRGASPAQTESLRMALHAALGDWETALAYGVSALQRSPADRETRRLLARAYVALGSAEEAEWAYRTLLEGDPSDSMTNEQLGVLLAIHDPAAARPYLQAAQTPLAQDVLDVLGEEKPAYRLARIGQACLTHAEPALAVLALRRAVMLRPVYADAHALLGQALEAMGQDKEALEHLKRAVDLAPRSPLAHSLLGFYYLERGDSRSARPYLETAYDLDPGNPVVSLYMAWLYADLGWYDVIGVWLDEAVRLSPDDPRIWEEVVRFCLERGLTERAVEAAQRLVEMEPGSAPAHDLLGWALFLNGDVEQAESCFREALQLDPDLALAYYHLGQVYLFLGEGERARRFLFRALDFPLAPDLRDRIETLLDGL